MMAFSGLVAFLPQIFLGPFAGVWIDRLKRNYVVIGADLFIGPVPADKLVKTNGRGTFLQSGAFMPGPVLGAVFRL